mmetsp:Transcript_1287/g.2057  ORF Transcript_1287/g.2057 Transcript_1287/m.2057 type:complete len:106 (-) Transcript_1287:23-340(-)
MSSPVPTPAQSNLINKLAQIDQECVEHNIVLEELLALKARDAEKSAKASSKAHQERVCYRLVNNVLIKKSMADIIQDLQDSKEHMLQVSKSLEDRLHQISREAGS